MKRALPLVIIVVVATVVLIVLGLTVAGPSSSGTVGIVSGSALPGFSANPSTPEQALANFLLDIQKRNWDRAFASLERTSQALTEPDFVQEWTGANGGLRSFSSLEHYDARPLHATNPMPKSGSRRPGRTPVARAKAGP